MNWIFNRRCVRSLAFLFVVGFLGSLSAHGQNYQPQPPYQPRPQYQPQPQQQYQAQPQQPYQAQPQQQYQAQPPYRMAQREAVAAGAVGKTSPVQKAIARPSAETLKRRSNEHPLMPTLRWAQTGLESIEQLHGYTARVVKRERVNGKVGDFEYMYIKVRHRPFSVYMYFLGPTNMKGQEVIYVEGANDGKMWAHAVGIRGMIGMVQIKPTNPLAMSGQRYPITELGIKNLVGRLLEVGDKDTKYGECEVSFLEGAKIESRPCTCIQVVHPVPRRNFLFHIARIYVDDELNIPIRYEAHDWPKGKDGKPELIEEYTYLDFTPNDKLSDADFDYRNPNYNFISK